LNEFGAGNAWDAFEQFIEENGGAYLDLTVKKIRDRGRIVNDPEHPNLLVLDIERHRSLPGSHYEKGRPMAAFETYIQRISFDPIEKQFEEISITVVDRSVSIAAIAEEQLDLARPKISLKTGSKNVRVVRIDGFPDFRVETSVLSEAVAAVRREFEDMNYTEILMGLGTSDEEDARYCRKVSDAVADLAAQEVKDLWDDAEEA